MATPNPKNLALGPAATDLGLGDALVQQTLDKTTEMKKRKQQQGLQAPPAGVNMGPATSFLSGLSGFGGGGFGL